MNQKKTDVFKNTRHQTDLAKYKKEMQKYIYAIHYCRHEEAKGILKIDPKLYQDDLEERSAVVYALMIYGGDLVSKYQIEEGCQAFFKAYQMDPDHPDVERLRTMIYKPKSAKEIEAVQRAILRNRMKNQNSKK